jgi:hypothetical protein
MTRYADWRTIGVSCSRMSVAERAVRTVWSTDGHAGQCGGISWALAERVVNPWVTLAGGSLSVAVAARLTMKLALRLALTHSR